MTREEVAKMLMTIQSVYPNYHVQDKTIAVNAWLEFIGELPYQSVMKAVKKYVLTNTSGFAPSVGQIVEIISNELCEEHLSDLEAWGLVYKAICNSGYHSEEEYAKLPELIKKAVGTPSNLREWSLMDIDTVQSVEQSHFLRVYRTLVDRKNFENRNPSVLVEMMNNNRLEEKENQIEQSD